MLHKRTRDLNAICKSYVDFIAKQTKACTNLRKLVGTCMQFRKVFGPENKARKDSEGTKGNCNDLCVIWTKFWAKQQNQNKIQGLTTRHGRTHMQNLKHVGLNAKPENQAKSHKKTWGRTQMQYPKLPGPKCKAKKKTKLL